MKKSERTSLLLQGSSLRFFVTLQIKFVRGESEKCKKNVKKYCIERQRCAIVEKNVKKEISMHTEEKWRVETKELWKTKSKKNRKNQFGF